MAFKIQSLQIVLLNLVPKIVTSSLSIKAYSRRKHTIPKSRLAFNSPSILLLMSSNAQRRERAKSDQASKMLNKERNISRTTKTKLFPLRHKNPIEY